MSTTNSPNLASVMAALRNLSAQADRALDANRPKVAAAFRSFRDAFGSVKR